VHLHPIAGPLLLADAGSTCLRAWVNYLFYYQCSIRKICAIEETTSSENTMVHGTTYKDKLLTLFGEDIHENLNKIIFAKHKILMEQNQLVEYIEEGRVILLADTE
jgi:hypothetical protein